MTYSELLTLKEKGIVNYSHTSYIRQYVSRKKEPTVQEYTGKFGIGYIVLSCNKESTIYSFITYYIINNK
jgi:hypothetical protein